MLNKEIPFLRIGLSFCVGILAGRYFKPDLEVPVILLSISVAVFLISIFFNQRQVNHIFGISLTIALFSAGEFLYSAEKRALSTLTPVAADYLVTVSEFPEKRPGSLRIVTKLNYRFEKDKMEPLKGSLLLNMKKSSAVSSLLPGDRLKIRLRPVEISNRGNPCEFDYKFYMENNGIRYTAFASEKDIFYQLSQSHRKLSHRALIMRENIIGMFEKRGITGERLALIAAITLGQKNLLEEEQKQEFMKAGIMHIMAVSGLHAVILSMFMFSLLSFLRGRFNFIRIIITVLFLWLFAFVTGLTPSVLRATIMFTFIQAGKLMSRNVNNINSVLASAMVLLIDRPSVLFDAGFLLSYSAVIFIICFYNDLYSCLDFKSRIGDKLWQSAAVTIVAQLGTLSLTITLFNRFPTYFILTNIVIVPLSSLLIIIGCLIPLTFPVAFISRPLAAILGFLTGLTGELTEKAASLPWSSIENIGMGSFDAFLLFVFIFILAESLLNHKTISMRYPLIALLFLTSFITISNIPSIRSEELIVYNTPGSYTVAIRSGKKLNLFTDNIMPPSAVLRHCDTKNYRLVMNRKEIPPLALDAGGKRILITSNLNNNILKKIRPDFIILCGKNSGNFESYRYDGKVSTLIITAGPQTLHPLPPDRLIDSLHYVRLSGAYRLKL